jgi:hypothetical protein
VRTAGASANRPLGRKRNQLEALHFAASLVSPSSLTSRNGAVIMLGTPSVVVQNAATLTPDGS